jgi:hypothetical protein
MTAFTDHHVTAFIYAATDTDPPEPVTIPLSNVRVWRPVGDRSPALAAAGWYELLYVEGFPSRPARALVTVDQLAAVLGWFAGYEHNRPIADAFEHRPFGADRRRVALPAPVTIEAPAPSPKKLTPTERSRLWRLANLERYRAYQRDRARQRRAQAKIAREIEQARLEQAAAQAQVTALSQRRVRSGPGHAAATSVLRGQRRAAWKAAATANAKVRALEAASA